MNFDIIKKICRGLCLSEGINPDAEIYLSEGVTVPVWSEEAARAVNLTIMVLAHLRDHIDEAVASDQGLTEPDAAKFATRFKKVMNSGILALDPNVDAATYDPEEYLVGLGRSSRSTH